jgi:hypothetical protein
VCVCVVEKQYIYFTTSYDRQLTNISVKLIFPLLFGYVWRVFRKDSCQAQVICLEADMFG